VSRRPRPAPEIPDPDAPGRPRPAVLHLAALPFPSPQGTQAAVAAMARETARAGYPTTLLTYGLAAGGPLPELGGAHHEVAAWPFPVPPERRSAATAPATLRRALRRRGGGASRSGPSPEKLVWDLALLRAFRRRLESRVGLVLAHHVEAAAVARIVAADPRAPRVPVVFVAHTDLAAELPSYLPAPLQPAARGAGAVLDRWLIAGADEVAAVSPALAARLPGRRARFLPIPWPLDDPERRPSQAEARRRLGLPEDRPTVLYAGNLDAYQGWEDLPRALSALERDGTTPVTWLLGTAADARPARRLLAELNLPPDRLRVRGLTGEAERAALHAAADWVVVPRRVPGGLPVKLLDALARGRPTVATPRALAGLTIPGETALLLAAADDDPNALAAALAAGLARDASERRRIGEAGRRWLGAQAADARKRWRRLLAHRTEPASLRGPARDRRPAP